MRPDSFSRAGRIYRMNSFDLLLSLIYICGLNDLFGIPMEYYIIVNEERKGPYSLEELQSVDFSADTLVWRAGMESWQPASSLIELQSILNSSKPECKTEQNSDSRLFFAIIDGKQTGPYTADALIGMGINGNTPVWTQGMEKWTIAENVDDFKDKFAMRPPVYSPEPPEEIKPFPIRRKCIWMGWAITSSIINFITMLIIGFPFIGLVFGILGIIYSNNADSKYASQFPELARSDESNARIMTIISMVIAGISIIGAVLTCIFIGVAILNA